MSTNVKTPRDLCIVLGHNHRNQKLAVKPFAQKPRRFALDIGRNISIELTLAAYGITPNAAICEDLGTDQ